MLEFMLYTSSGQKWKSHRKLIAPTFHLNVLKSFVDLFNANSRAVCEKMAKENGKPFDCHDYMSECTVEILLGKSKTLVYWFSTCEPRHIKWSRAFVKCKAKLWVEEWLHKNKNEHKRRIKGAVRSSTKFLRKWETVLQKNLKLQLKSIFELQLRHLSPLK